MSTAKIREALDLIQARHPQAFEAASTELEDIEKAALFLRALAPAEVVDLYKTNPRDQKLLDWLRAADLMHGIANDYTKRTRAKTRTT